MASSVLVDGKASVTVPVFDRGFNYGDGLFETLRVIGQQPLRWQLHLDRLFRGCDRLGISLPDGFAGLLAAEAAALLQPAGLSTKQIPREQLLKIIVTRGQGGRGYRTAENMTPCRVVSIHPMPQWPADYAVNGAVLRTCHYRLSDQPGLAGLKTLNRLDQVQARREWTDAGIQDGIVLDQQGNVVETTMANLFMIHDQKIITPRLHRCGIEGVTKQAVLRGLCRLGIPFFEEDLPLSRVRQADGLFITNSVIGIWPVIALDQQRFAIHPWTRTLQADLASSAGSGE